MNRNDDSKILARIAPREWFAQFTEQRCAAELYQLSEATSALVHRRKTWEGRLDRMRGALERAIGGEVPTDRLVHLRKLRGEARELRRVLARERNAFVEGPLRYLLPPNCVIARCDDDLQALHQSIHDRAHELVEKHMDGCLGALVAIEEACSEAFNEEDMS